MRVSVAGLIAAVLTGCAVPSAWVISRTTEGGVVGYSSRAHLFMGEDERKRAMDAALAEATSEVCGGRRYSVLWDRRESEVRSRTTTKSVSEQSDSDFKLSGYGRGTIQTKTTREVPVTENFTVSWREMGISCGLPPWERIPNEVAKPIVRRVAPSNESPPEQPRCTARLLEEMGAAGVSASAIEAACGKTEAAPPAVDSITNTEIAATFAESQPAFQRCGNEQRRLDGDGGRLVIKFVLTASGAVNDAVIDSKEGTGTSVTSCWLEVAKSLSFPSHPSKPPEFRFPFKY